MNFIVLDFDQVLHDGNHSLLETHAVQILILTNVENDLSASFDKLDWSSWHDLQQIDSLFCFINPKIIHWLGISQEEINKLPNYLNDSIVDKFYLKIDINWYVTQCLDDVFNHFIRVVDSFDII